MAIFTQYVTRIVADVSSFFEHSDVQTTTIAIAVTSSLCITVLWFIVNLVHSLQEQQTQEQEDQPNCLFNDTYKKISVVSSVSSFHMSRKGQSDFRQSPDRNARPVSKSIWSSRQIERKCSVPCIRCGSCSADKQCRYVLCEACCQQSAATVCCYHAANSSSKTYNYMNHGPSKNKPTQIDLSNLHLEECPARVGYLGSQLVSLNLSNNNLQILPEEIGCLLGLNHLYLQCNSLETLPESLGNLSKLEELDIRQNILFNLPSNVGSLCNLRILKADSNQLECMPPSIGSLTHLEYLSAGHNSLEHIPFEVCHLSKLGVLHLHHNKLSTLPCNLERLVRLRELDISSNQLQLLPFAITRCSALLKLNVAHNRLQQLPCQLGRLHQLEELHAGGNCLHYLPASIDCLTLNKIEVVCNPLWSVVDCPRTSRKLTDLSVLPLLELAAKTVITENIPWHNFHIPAVLKDMLSQCHFCSSCHTPLFDYQESSLVFRQICAQNLPLFQQKCPANNKCKFIEIA